MTLREFLAGIADAIRDRDGSTGTLYPLDFASRIKAILTLSETADADAGPADMAAGKTAWVDSEKLVGTLPEKLADASVTIKGDYITISADETNITITAEFLADYIMRSGSNLAAVVPLEKFGDVLAEEVMAGKFFTSAAGFMQEGKGKAIGAEYEVTIYNASSREITVYFRGYVSGGAGFGLSAGGTCTFSPIMGEMFVVQAVGTKAFDVSGTLRCEYYQNLLGWTAIACRVNPIASQVGARTITITDTDEAAPTYQTQTKTVTPTAKAQTILPDNGYDALASVIVEKIPDSYMEATEAVGVLEINKTGDLQDVEGDVYALEGKPAAAATVGPATTIRIKGKLSDLGDAPASAVLRGFTFTSEAGVEQPGEMPNKGAMVTEITDAAQIVAIPEGFHNGNGSVRIAPEEVAKLTPANIAKGVTILGVPGNHSVNDYSIWFDSGIYLFYKNARMYCHDKIMAALVSPDSCEGMYKENTQVSRIDFSAVVMGECTDMSSFAYGASELSSVILSGCDLSKVTTIASAFRSCPNLQGIYLEGLDFSSVANAANAFRDSGLTYIDLSSLDFSACTNVSSIFYGCKELAQIVGFAFPACTNFFWVFPIGDSSGNSALAHLTFKAVDKAISGDFSVAFCSFTRDGFVEMFNSLPAGSGSITISNNPGTAELLDSDKALATSKGWTLVM